MTIFGLLMWSVMFSDMEDVLQSKFQVYVMCTMFCFLMYRLPNHMFVFGAAVWCQSF
jgi:hypothetical protein